MELLFKVKFGESLAAMCEVELLKSSLKGPESSGTQRDVVLIKLKALFAL